MSKKRGLSLDEKRIRLLEVFHESGEVFVLKEVEKLGVKKGITPQSIKDVLQSLIDDDIVHQERIGSANYFWSFPSEASVLLENETEKTKQTIESTQLKKAEIQKELEESQSKKEDTEERREKESQLEALKKEMQQLEEELVLYRDNDPDVFRKIKDGIELAKTSANQWLDNLFALKCWTKKQFLGMDNEISKLFEQYGISEDIDYLE